MASNLNHFLEEPDDASVEARKTDPTLNKARQLRNIATKAVIELDHSDKWAAACKYPSRLAETNLFLPGHQVMFWRKQSTRKTGEKIAKSGKARGAKVPERWYGPGVIIGHEWDRDKQSDSYWIS